MKKRKIVYSHWSLNRIGDHFEQDSLSEDKEYFLYLSELSNKWSQKNGFETILYTDKEGEELLKVIPYNEIRIFDQNLINSLPKEVWSLAKLVAMADMNEPFAHIDFDFFIIDNNLEFNDFPFLTFHHERWLDNEINNAIKEFALEKFNIDGLFTKEEFIRLATADTNNCSILIFNEGFDIIKENANKLIELAKKNIHLYDYEQILIKDIEPEYSTFAFAVFFEQVLFVNMFKEKFGLKYAPNILNGKNFYDLNQQCLHHKLAHMWTGKKYLSNLDLDSILNNIKNNINNPFPEKISDNPKQNKFIDFSMKSLTDENYSF